MGSDGTPRSAGRPRRIGTTDIVRAGREIGMRELSLKSVAARLGVSSTALYRHVDGRWGLERLVGESLLGELRLEDDPEQDAERHLVRFGLLMRDHVLAHPGLAGYLQTLFPRGDAGRALIVHEVDALERRGHRPDVAVALSGAVASIAIGYAAAEDLQRQRAEGIEGERAVAEVLLAEDARLGGVHRGLPDVDSRHYLRLVLTAAVRGLLASATAGLPLADVLADLDGRSSGL